MNYVPRIRPASDVEIKPRRSLLACFRDFWTHPTIDAMQAQMLREVWAKWKSLQFHAISARYCRRIHRTTVGRPS